MICWPEPHHPFIYIFCKQWHSPTQHNIIIKTRKFTNNEFSTPIHILPNVSIMSFINNPVQTHTSTFSYVSLISFILESFLSLSLIFINLTFLKFSFFVDRPSIWICQMFALFTFRLYTFSRNVTEMMLCPHCIYSPVCDFVSLWILFLLLTRLKQCLPGFTVTTFFFFSLMLINEHFVGRQYVNISFLIKAQVIHVKYGPRFPISAWCSNWPRFRQGELLQAGFYIFFTFPIILWGLPCFPAQLMRHAYLASCFNAKRNATHLFI